MKNHKISRLLPFLLVLTLVMSCQSAALSEQPISEPDGEKITEISTQIAALETQINDLNVQKDELEKELLQLQGGSEKNEILFDYKALSRDPDKYVGCRTSFTGTILQVMEDSFSDEVSFRIASKSYSDDVVYTTFSISGDYSRFLEDDKVYVTGIFDGLESYKTVLGSTVTIPAFTIEKIGLVTDDDSPYSVSAEDINIQTYLWASSYNNYCAFEITSNASIPVSLDISVRFYDKGGNLTGVDDSSVDVLGPNEQTIVMTSNDAEFSRVEYEVTPKTDPYYRSPLSGLSYKISKSAKKVIVELKNESDTPADFVEGYVLFMSKGKVVDYDWTYFTDSDSEIKPGKTIYKELDTSKKFDDVKVYFTGRISN